jgi:hypothetical protein
VLVAPVASGVVGVGWVVAATVGYRPEGVGVVVCPFRHATGLDCPGCGSTRALGALGRLDLVAALDHHVLVPIALVVVVLSWVLWTRGRWRAQPATDVLRGPPVILAIAVGLVAFTVFRNTPAGAWFASGLAG